MEGKENELMTKERICMWYKDWSCTVKFIHSSYLLSLFYSIIPIYIVCNDKNGKTLWFVDFSSI